MSKKSLLRALLAAAMVLLAPSLSAAEAPVPSLKTRVTDLTGTLRDYQRTALEAKLAAFERRRGSQVAVLIVKTTQPDTIEQFSMRVVEKWKLGHKRLDDGALLLVAVEDKKVRIEVGYGLEGALPDLTAKRIIEEVINPNIRQGSFYDGISLGVDRILRVIEGEPLPLPPPQARRQPEQPLPLESSPALRSFSNWMLLIGLTAIVTALAYMLADIRRFQIAGFLGVIAGVSSAVAVDFYFGIVMGLLAFLAVLWYGRGWNLGGWGGSSGTWSGGGHSSGASSDGEFFGGGGEFGGGGASGDWGDWGD